MCKVEYFKQQVVQRDKYILGKVLMDRIADYRLDISKLESTSSHPLVICQNMMMGFIGRKVTLLKISKMYGIRS